MTQVFLTSGSTNPWPTPGDWNNAANSVELVGRGGVGGVGLVNANAVSGGGGGGAAYRKRINLTLSGNNPWRVGTAASAVTTRFGNDGTTGTNFFGAQFGVDGATGAAGGGLGAGGAATEETGGTPPGSSPTGFAGGSGSAGAKGNAGGSGGGSAGPSGAGQASGGPGGSLHGGGGGGSNGGSSTAGQAGSVTLGSGVGGDGSLGHTLAPGGGPQGTDGAPGTNGGAGGGGEGSAIASQSGTEFGGAGSADQCFDATHGVSGGGGGSGCFSGTGSTTAVTGGAGANYGGGGGGGGNVRGAGTSTGGTCGIGLIVITYTATPPPVIVFGFDQQGCDEAQPLTNRGRRFGPASFLRGIDGIERPFTPGPSSAWPAPDHWRNPSPRAQTAATMRGDDGNYVQLVLPSLSWPEPPMWRNPAPKQAGAIMPSESGIEFPMPPVVPVPWWEQTFAPPPHRVWRSPEFGDQGIQAAYVRFSPNFDVQDAQDSPLAKWLRTRSGGIMRGIDGIERSMPPFTPWGETSPALTFHRIFHAPEVGDGGIAAPYVAFTALEWPHQQTWYRRPPRLGTIARGDDGNLFPMPTAPPVWFETTPALVRRYLFRSPDVGDPGIEAPFIRFSPSFDTQDAQGNPLRTGFARRGAFARGVDGTDFPMPAALQAWFEFNQPTTFHRLFRSPEIGDGGIALPMPAVVSALVPWWEQTATLQRFKPNLGGLDLTVEFSTFPFLQPWSETTPHTTPHRFFKSPEFGDGGIEFPMPTVAAAPVPWWEQTFAQPPHRIFRSPEFGDQGIQAPYVAFTALEWPHQQTWYRRPPRSGTIARGDDGNAFPMPVPPVPFFETSPALVRHYLFRSPDVGDPGIEAPFVPFTATAWPEPPMWRNPSPRARSAATMRGDDGNYVQLVLPNLSWPEPPMWRNPAPVRAGAIMPSEYGIEAPFIPPPAIPYQWWDDRQPQERLRIPPTRFGATLAGGDLGNQAPMVTFFPYGWEVPQPQPPPWPKPTRGSGIALGEPGIQAPLIQFVAQAWPEPPAWPHPRRERSGGLAFGELGIEAPFTPAVAPVAWGYEQPAVLGRFKPTLGGLDLTVQFPTFAPWVNLGFEPQVPQPPWPKSIRGAGIALGDPGMQGPLVRFLAQAWPEPPAWPHPRRERSGALAFGELGIEAPFVAPPVAPVVWGYEQPVVLPRFKRALAGLDLTVQFPTFAPWVNLGFEEVVSQEPRARWKWEKAAAAMRGDDGNLAPMVRFFPTGWETQPPQPPSGAKPRRGAWMFGELGIEAPFVPPPPPPTVAWGYEQLPFLQRFKRTLAGLDLTVQFPVFAPWVNLGYEQIFSQEPHPRREKAGTLFGGHLGIENPIPLPAPPYGWPLVYSQEPHRPRANQYGAIMAGDPGTQAPLVRFFPQGWPIQPPQPPSAPRTFRYGAIAQGDPGTQAKLNRFFPLGFEPTPPLFFRRPLPHVPVFMLDSVQEFGFIAPPSLPSVVCVTITPYGAQTTLGAMELTTIIKAFGSTVTIKRQDCT